jgi:hypothetical protein
LTVREPAQERELGPVLGLVPDQERVQERAQLRELAREPCQRSNPCSNPSLMRRSMRNQRRVRELPEPVLRRLAW